MDDSTRIFAIAGGAAGVLAALAWLFDRRRVRRRDLDKVGFMPWTAIFFWALMAAVLMLALSAQGWTGE